MPCSVDPLVIGYSFAANAAQATDKVNLAALDAVLAQISDKLNELIIAVDVSTRDDNTLADSSIEPRHLSREAYMEITAIVNGTAVPPA